MKARWIVIGWIALGVCALPWVGYTALVARGVADITALPSQIQGCPSKAVPLYPGSELTNSSVISVGVNTGCWANYRVPSQISVGSVFGYYTDQRAMAGWRLDEAYPNTGFASFSRIGMPRLRADVEVDTLRDYFVLGATRVIYAISICFCDPRSMSQ